MFQCGCHCSLQGARRLKLRNLPECAGMSGGRAIEHLARSGDPHAFTFPSPLLQHGDCSFSFAGLKQCLFKTVENLEGKHGKIPFLSQKKRSISLAMFQLLLLLKIVDLKLLFEVL